MAVAVVTDSAAAIPRELASQAGIVVVPMRLSIGPDSYEEDDVPLEEVVRRFDEGVRTSGPAPAAFTRAIEEAGARGGAGDGAVILTVSERMSSTHKSALLAADLAAELGGPPIRVMDTSSAAGAQALVVLAAAGAAAAGADLDAVVSRANHVRRQVRLVAAVETLDFLVMGGRLPDLAGRAGRYLGVRPLFEFRDGRIKPLRPAMSRDGAVEALLGHWRRSRPRGRALHVVVLHALAPEAAGHLAAAVRAEAEPATCLVESFGPVMVAHTGPGVTGLAWWWE
ncbi:MAG: DegV family protein [Acidimicrobiales bacterium]